MIPSLTIAMTTAPRRTPTLPRALVSLRAAGFSEALHLFAEPDTALPDLDDRTIVHAHDIPQGCFHNWRGAAQHLAALADDASWIMIVQDDAIWSLDAAELLRKALQEHQDQHTGFLSPYVMGKDVPRNAVDGWHELHSGWEFWGALALCMKRDAVVQLLEAPRFVNHPTNQQVDALVAATMLDLGRPSYVHVPSLVDHIGVTSTLGHDREIAHARGYRFGQRVSAES